MPPHPAAVRAAEVTGHRRFLDLCDPDHADFNPAYLGLVKRIAAGEPWPPAGPAARPKPAAKAPPLLTRAANFARAAVSHVSAGMPTLDGPGVAARLAVCHGCDQRLPGGTCAGCGCNLRLKASWADQVCPLGRWPAVARPPAPAVVGWVHVATIGAWEPILRELLDGVERSGLRAATSRVFAGVVGPDADLSWLPDWVTVVKRDGPLGMGENSTLQALWDWSRTAPPSKVWYLHTKGASHPGNRNVAAWRDYLTHFNVERWRDCAAALDAHDAAGTDYVAVDENPWFVALWGARRLRPGSRGFAGNFWWARSDYLASMPDAAVTLDRDRWDAEWSFVGAGRPRVKVLHDARVNLYNTHYPRSRYEARP